MSNKDLSRRDFIHTAGKAGMAAGLTGSVLTTLAKTSTNPGHLNIPPDPIPYTQRPLPYAYTALEPSIDAMTLAEAVTAEKVDTTKVSLEDLLGSITKYSTKMRNNAGGHYNHSLFWEMMHAPAAMAGGPSPALTTAINGSFGSLDAMKTKFNDAAKGRFGSGWAWVIVKKDGKLDVVSTANQDNPLMDIPDNPNGQPLIGLDVWEHAYYLKYQNKRPDYISAWWAVVNWDYINTRYAV